jgi:dihydrofolate reductase
MGRKTFSSIGKFLPRRMNLILTKNKKLLLENKLFQQHQETNNM